MIGHLEKCIRRGEHPVHIMRRFHLTARELQAKLCDIANVSDETPASDLTWNEAKILCKDSLGV